MREHRRTVLAGLASSVLLAALGLGGCVRHTAVPDGSPLIMPDTATQADGLYVVVHDEFGKTALAGAEVTVMGNGESPVPTTALTDHHGVASFPTRPARSGYRVRVLLPGYAPYEGELPTETGLIATWEVRLHPILEEHLRVEGTSDVIEFNDEFVQDLSLPGRFYQNTLTLAPGVSESEGDGNPNVHSARDRDFKARVNGISNQDPLTGQFLSLANPDSIEGIEIVTAGAGAEYGRAHGGFANIIVSPQDHLSAPNTDSYARIDEPGFLPAASSPLSTFAVDVDRASYAIVRRHLVEGRRPPQDAVRLEELVNYFPYDYPEPSGDAPVAVHVENAPAPWAPEHRLVRIALQARRVDTSALPPSTLVFLVDVSGSMEPLDRLPLVKSALALLVEQLRPQDRVAIAVYAGAAGLVLPATPGNRKADILAALDRLEAGGSTAGGAGLRLAYQLAEDSRDPGDNARVILATDGDFNVGPSSDAEMVRLVEEYRSRRIALSVLGVGSGNLEDSKMEALADHGDGNYAYVDTLLEARRALVEELGGTLATVAKDVKVQVEFNPSRVHAWRLLGYENRALAAEDFADDTEDAGDMGAGHAVTAFYEIVPAGAHTPAHVPAAPDLVYQERQVREQARTSPEWMTVQVRWQPPEGGPSRLLRTPVAGGTAAASSDFQFASAVAEFALLLRDSPHKGLSSAGAVLDRAHATLGDDRDGRRAEFVRLVDAWRTTVRGQGGETPVAAAPGS